MRTFMSGGLKGGVKKNKQNKNEYKKEINSHTLKLHELAVRLFLFPRERVSAEQLPGKPDNIVDIVHKKILYTFFFIQKILIFLSISIRPQHLDE